MKPAIEGRHLDVDGRSPQGERGLKPISRLAICRTRESLPARGAWVETRIVDHQCSLAYIVAPRKGSVG